MLGDVKLWIGTCMECAMWKGSPNKTMGPMGTIQSTKPMEIMGAGIVGPLPLSLDGNKYLLVFTDHYMKFAHAVPIPDQEAETIANAWAKEVICRMGTPE